MPRTETVHTSHIYVQHLSLLFEGWNFLHVPALRLRKLGSYEACFSTVVMRNHDEKPKV